MPLYHSFVSNSAHNDFLSLVEFKKFVEQKFDFLSFEIAVEKSYKRSANADQQIKQDQFPDLLKNLLLYNRILQMMKHHDSNHDNVLDLKEFTNALKALKPGFDAQTEKEAPIAFKRCDRNGNGLLDFDEFCAWAGPFLLPSLLEPKPVVLPE